MEERKSDGRERCSSCGKPGPELDAKLATALKHPLRAQLLAKLNERSSSPSELAEQVGADVNNVSYHCRVLADLGCAEVVKREEGKRGTLKTIYRGTTRMFLDDDVWPTLSIETRTGISLKAVGETIERAKDALEAGTFDAKDNRHAFNWKIDVDEEGWEEIADAGAEFFETIGRIEVAAANRRPEPSERIRATVSVLSYVSPPGR
jgi:DNA-binding transcriptional ArsR family regulator